MNKITRISALLLTLALLLPGCGATNEETAPATTQPTVPLLAEVATQEELVAGLAASPRVTLTADLQLTEMVGMKDNRIFNGGGHTITGPELQQVEVETEEGKEMQNVVETENALMICSGTVENVNIKGAYRCLGDCKAYPMTGDVRIKNVNAEGTLYALSIGRGDKSGSLYVDDCTFRGWVNINKIKTAQFRNCTFGFDENGKNGYFRCFIDTTMIGCNFEPWVKENGSTTRYNISFYKSTSGVTLTLEDCYVGDTLITQDNVGKLLKLTLTGNKVVVRNTQ